MNSKKTPLLRTLPWLLSGFVILLSSPAQAVVNTGNLCTRQTSYQERKDNIPRYLLTAISLAESSLWDSGKRAVVAWPWTVTALGKGRYFATKTGAITRVLELWSKNIRNIDVGCMQINLGYHAGAFDSLEQALDPAANVAYASRYLSSIFKTTRSWTQAAAYYHSTTPEKYRPYKLKVLKFWDQERQNASAGNGIVVHRYIPRNTIDRVRTERLNAYFKASRVARRASSPADIRRLQIAAWRTFGGKSRGMPQLAEMRRSRLNAMRISKLHKKKNSAKLTRFAEKRRAQLQAWRRDNRSTDNPS